MRVRIALAAALLVATGAIAWVVLPTGPCFLRTPEGPEIRGRVLGEVPAMDASSRSLRG